MSTIPPAKEHATPPGSTSDSPRLESGSGPADEHGLNPDYPGDATLAPHPLAGMFHRLAARVGILAGHGASAQDEAELAALHQDTIWISHILDAWHASARVRARASQVKPVPIDLQRLARERVEANTGLAAQKRVRLTFETQSVSEVMGEPAVVELLLKALLSAALLASRSGSVLSLTFAGTEAAVSLRLNLSETGTPPAVEIAPGDDAPALGQEVLSGLVGLLFPLAESQAGSLTVEVQPGAAIEITFSLPASQPASAPAENTVLIVDDDPDGAFLLEQVLLKAGFQVLIARNGLEGLSLARRKGVTVILLDVMLPGLDGFEVCHRLREDAVTAKKPIVMISAKGRPEDRQMGLRVGADDYMTKPLGMNEVVQTVTRFMKSNEEGSDD